MSDLIEITDEERDRVRAAALRLRPPKETTADEVAIYNALRSLATRKPVGDGEVVVRLTREEAQVLVGRAELAFGGVATLDTRIRTPLGDKLRAALNRGGSDE